MVLSMKYVGELTNKGNNLFTYGALNLSDKELDRIIRNIEDIPKEYMRKQDDCNRMDLAYNRCGIKQLRPSTHPVFWIKECDVVVKVFYNVDSVKNEIWARVVLENFFDTIPAKMVSCEKYYLLITPYVKNMIMLSELSRKDFGCFLRDYDDVLRNIINYIDINKKEVKDCNKVMYAGRSIECMKAWAYGMLQLVEKYNIYSYVTGNNYSLFDIINRTVAALEKKPSNLCLFSGDVNCHNIMHTEKGCICLDFEYWGNIDVDYLFSVIIGSIFNHCEIVDNVYVDYDSHVGKVAYSLKKDILKMKSISAFRGMELDYERIRGFIISRMYYKFLNLINNWNEDKNIVSICMILDFFEIIKSDSGRLAMKSRP